MILLPGLFVLGCFLGIYLQDATRLFISFMTFIYMPLAVAAPVLLRIVWRLRHRGAGKARAGLVFMALLLGASALSGCQNLVEIEDRNYVMCLGIDKAGEGLSASFGFPDLKALTGDGDNIHYPAVTISGKDMEGIEESYGARSNKRLDYGQLQMIVFGREMLEDEALMRAVLEYFKEHQEFTRTVLVCMADEKAADIVALDEAVNGSIGVYLRQMFDNNSRDYRLTVGDLIIGLSLTKEPGEIAVVRAADEVPLTVDTQTISGFFVRE